MKRLLKIAIVLVVLGAAIYPLRQMVLTRLAPTPCAEPITYMLGAFDSRFGISKEYFLSALRDAEAVWEKPIGKALFTYAPETGHLKINLVYDYRQQATSKLEGLGIAVKNDQASYTALKTKYAELRNRYTESKNEYDTRVQAFDEKNKAYQKQVLYWNARGGAPRDEYAKLETERITLQTESAKLQTMQAQINETVNEINAFVVVLNRLVGSLNLAVEKYNTVGASRGESFEEGVYQNSAGNQEIDIYEFSSRDKLVRALAHELGHALELEHVDDPQAIMYKLNTSDNKALSQTDITELKAKCAIEN